MGKTCPMPVVSPERDYRRASVRCPAGRRALSRYRRPATPSGNGTLSAWLFNRAFVSMSYLPIAMF